MAEAAQLTRLCDLAEPRVDVVLILGSPPDPDVVNYWNKILEVRVLVCVRMRVCVRVGGWVRFQEGRVGVGRRVWVRAWVGVVRACVRAWSAPAGALARPC